MTPNRRPQECFCIDDTQAPSKIDLNDTGAEQLLKETRDVDMPALRENFIVELLQAASDTVRILYASTGSGCDARAFHRAGSQVWAFDASPKIVKTAEVFAELPVQQRSSITSFVPFLPGVTVSGGVSG